MLYLFLNRTRFVLRLMESLDMLINIVGWVAMLQDWLDLEKITELLQDFGEECAEKLSGKIIPEKLKKMPVGKGLILHKNLSGDLLKKNFLKVGDELKGYIGEKARAEMMLLIRSVLIALFECQKALDRKYHFIKLTRKQIESLDMHGHTLTHEIEMPYQHNEMDILFKHYFSHREDITYSSELMGEHWLDNTETIVKELSHTDVLRLKRSQSKSLLYKPEEVNRLLEFYFHEDHSQQTPLRSEIQAILEKAIELMNDDESYKILGDLLEASHGKVVKGKNKVAEGSSSSSNITTKRNEAILMPIYLDNHWVLLCLCYEHDEKGQCAIKVTYYDPTQKGAMPQKIRQVLINRNIIKNDGAIKLATVNQWELNQSRKDVNSGLWIIEFARAVVLNHEQFDTFLIEPREMEHLCILNCIAPVRSNTDFPYLSLVLPVNLSLFRDKRGSHVSDNYPHWSLVVIRTSRYQKDKSLRVIFFDPGCKTLPKELTELISVKLIGYKIGVQYKVIHIQSKKDNWLSGANVVEAAIQITSKTDIEELRPTSDDLLEKNRNIISHMSNYSRALSVYTTPSEVQFLMEKTDILYERNTLQLLVSREPNDTEKQFVLRRERLIIVRKNEGIKYNFYLGYCQQNKQGDKKYLQKKIEFSENSRLRQVLKHHKDTILYDVGAKQDAFTFVNAFGGVPPNGSCFFHVVETICQKIKTYIDEYNLDESTLPLYSQSNKDKPKLEGDSWISLSAFNRLIFMYNSLVYTIDNAEGIRPNNPDGFLFDVIVALEGYDAKLKAEMKAGSVEVEDPEGHSQKHKKSYERFIQSLHNANVGFIKAYPGHTYYPKGSYVYAMLTAVQQSKQVDLPLLTKLHKIAFAAEEKENAGIDLARHVAALHAELSRKEEIIACLDVRVRNAESKSGRMQAVMAAESAAKQENSRLNQLVDEKKQKN